MKLHLIALFALCGCSSSTMERPARIPTAIAVAVGCVSGDRPDEVIPLNKQHPDWSEKTVKQKAELVSAQALRYKSYGESLNAATGACE